MGIGPVIAGLRLPRAFGKSKFRGKSSWRQFQIGIAFIVPQNHVVAGPVAFDEVAFQEKRLVPILREDKLHGSGLPDQGTNLGILLALSVEIRSDSLFKRDGLTHIEDRSLGALEEVDPGRIRKGRRFSF